MSGLNPDFVLCAALFKDQNLITSCAQTMALVKPEIKTPLVTYIEANKDKLAQDYANVKKTIDNIVGIAESFPSKDEITATINELKSAPQTLKMINLVYIILFSIVIFFLIILVFLVFRRRTCVVAP